MKPKTLLKIYRFGTNDLNIFIIFIHLEDKSSSNRFSSELNNVVCLLWRKTFYNDVKTFFGCTLLTRDGTCFWIVIEFKNLKCWCINIIHFIVGFIPSYTIAICYRVSSNCWIFNIFFGYFVEGSLIRHHSASIFKSDGPWNQKPLI